MSRQDMMKLYDLTPADFGEKDIQTLLTEKIQRFMDNVARGRGYDNIASACSYANENEPNEKFRNEGFACLRWRSAVWSYCYEQLALYEQGKRDIPTDIISELPVLEW